MLKKCLGRQFLFVFLLFFIFSCSFFESSDKNASLSFRVDESFVEKITSELSRVAVGQNESEKSDGTGIFGENLWLEISVKGDWERAKNLPFAGGTTLLFENVPVGSEIYAEAFIYQPENSDGSVKGSGEAPETASESASGRKVLYKGVSEKIRIEQGENSLPLVIKKSWLKR